MNKIKYVIDIDGTICSKEESYENAKPFFSRIEKINNLYDDGNTIILFTARGMGRTKNNSKKAKRAFKKITEKQLKLWNVKYTKLIFGKPSGDYYIDDKGLNADDFFKFK